MDKRTVALGVAAVAAVAAAVTVSVAGRGDAHPKREAVGQYIKDVDRVQQQMRVRLTKTFQAYRQFAGGHNVDPKLRGRLGGSEETLRKLRRRLASLPAPVSALRLRRRLLALVDAEIAVAREVAGIARFNPEFVRLLARARKAGGDLSIALAAVTPPQAHTIRGTKAQVAAAQAAFASASAQAAGRQADAIDSYVSEIARLQRALEALAPPEVMQPAFDAQVATLVASQRAGNALSAELRKPDRSRVAVLGRRFTLAGRTASTVRAQRAQIAAVKAYNARVRSIGALQARVQSELTRLQRLQG
jgi:hypothetical protein